MNLTVHVSLDAEGHLSPAARVERAEHLTLQSLAELLDGKQVRVQPVIDLNDAPQEDGYVPSERLRQAVGLAFEHEVFPYSNRSAAGCDLDHTVAYQGGRRGQTRLGNLAPLSRRIHRAKTAGVWKLRRPQPGVFEWTSPLGLHYRVTRHGTVRLA